MEPKCIKRACIPRYWITEPCIFIKDKNLNNGCENKVKWTYQKAIREFSNLITNEEKKAFSVMLKNHSDQDAKAILLNGFQK